MNIYVFEDGTIVTDQNYDAYIVHDEGAELQNLEDMAWAEDAGKITLALVIRNGNVQWSRTVAEPQPAQEIRNVPLGRHRELNDSEAAAEENTWGR